MYLFEILERVHLLKDLGIKNLRRKINTKILKILQES